MIEALIDHIRNKGFEVSVHPGKLFISKVVNGRSWTLTWGISEAALRQAHKEGLIAEADRRLAQFIEATR